MDLVLLPFNDYKKGEQVGFRDRDNHFIRWLAEGGGDGFERILVIDRPMSLAVSLARRACWHARGGSLLGRGVDWMLRQTAPRLFVLDCLDLSILEPLRLGRAWWAKAYQAEPFRRRVAKTLESLAFRDFTVLLHHPFGAELALALGGRRLVFDAIDNFLKIAHFASLRPAMAAQYELLRQRADALVAVTPQAGENLFGDRLSFHVIPNGVNIEFFRSSTTEHDYAPLKDCRRIKVLYTGTLAHRIDIPLLERIAASTPQAEFFLFGPVVNPRDFARLRRMENVHLPGNFHYHLIPSLLRDADLCLIPHSLDQQMDGDLLKLYEYAAANKPVIITRILGHEQFIPPMRAIGSAGEFAAALEAFRREGFRVHYPPELLAGRSWAERFGQFASILQGSPD